MSAARDERIRPIVSARGEGHAIRNPFGEAIEFQARMEQTAGALTAFEAAPAPGEGPPLHVHVDEDEVLYCLEGRFRIKIDDEVHDMVGGTFTFLPKGVPHAWQNIDDAPGRILVVFVPAAPGMERFFERLADVPAGPAAAQAFGELAGESGMTVVGPPLAQSDPLP